jgi:predicted flap endonuclease-1-like 5' DNA nuclease
MMKTQFESMMEGQKKAWDFWSETSKKMVDQLNDLAKPNKQPADFMADWMRAQQKLWEETMQSGNLKDTFEKTPEQFRNWAKLQNDLVQQWTRFYAENADKMGVKMPPMNGKMSERFMTDAPKEWANWMEQANTWMKDNILAKLPFPQGFHYQNFNELYEGMYQYWEPLQRMMKSGITDWKGIEAFFQPDAYQEIVGRFMGFKPVGDLSAMLEQVNGFFDQYGSWMKQYAPAGSDWQEQWKSVFTPSMNASVGPHFQAVLDINNTVREGLESLYNVAGQTKEVEMAKLVKDIQFTYIAFILKTVDMQNRVFQAGQNALPDTIERYYKKYRNEKQLPDYQTFFNEYVNDLEGYMIEVLESKDYSLLQNEVATAGVTVKSKLDELVELAFSDVPFLMQSHADEVAIETGALRKKLRRMESRLAELEARLGEQQEDPHQQLLSWIGTASAKEKDDLKKIKGIGPKLEDMLNSIGVFTYQQVSKMTDVQYKLVDQLISAFQGRAQRDGWADQAKELV